MKNTHFDSSYVITVHKLDFDCSYIRKVNQCHLILTSTKYHSLGTLTLNFCHVSLYYFHFIMKKQHNLLNNYNNIYERKSA